VVESFFGCSEKLGDARERSPRRGQVRQKAPSLLGRRKELKQRGQGGKGGGKGKGKNGGGERKDKSRIAPTYDGAISLGRSNKKEAGTDK